jgi:hypothetical protein
LEPTKVSNTFTKEPVMSSRSVLGIVLAASFVIATWVLAQQQQSTPSVGQVGSFAVSGSSDPTVLVDTRSGKTWILIRGSEGQWTWLPTKRIDSDKEVQDWLREQDMIHDQAKEREKAREKDKSESLKR